MFEEERTGLRKQWKKAGEPEVNRVELEREEDRACRLAACSEQRHVCLKSTQRAQTEKFSSDQSRVCLEIVVVIYLIAHKRQQPRMSSSLTRNQSKTLMTI